MIHAAGDSHTQIFVDDPRVTRMPDIPCTAYQLINPSAKLKAGELIREYAKKLGKDDILILSAGEIDCRIHVYQCHVRTGRTIMNIIRETIDRLSLYIQTLPCKVMLLGIPPPGWQENVYKYPNYAGPETQAKIYARFYAAEREYFPSICPVKYIDMYDKFVGRDGHVKPEFLRDDKVHLKVEAKEHALDQVQMV